MKSLKTRRITRRSKYTKSSYLNLSVFNPIKVKVVVLRSRKAAWGLDEYIIVWEQSGRQRERWNWCVNAWRQELLSEKF